MSAPPQAAEAAAAAAAYQQAQARTSAAAAAGAIRAWRQIDGKNLDMSWLGVLGRLLAIVTGAQRKAAAAAPPYLGRLLRLQDTEAAAVRLSADAFAGLTGDGRPMESLLYTPVAYSKHLIGSGVRIDQALRAEELHMAMLVRTQVQDAGRMAVQAAMAAQPRLRGYVRHVNLPSCARCIILAGRFYRYSDGFQRHPNCDCTMIPAVGEEFVEPQDPAELITQMRDKHAAKLRQSLSGGDLKALEHGADLNQVVNAHRGMTTAAGPGRRIGVTTEGTTKRGFAGHRLAAEGFAKSGSRYQRARTPRLTPAQVFEEAAREKWDRAEIVRQLTRFGYII
jgi:hypothetical protein